jgi:hypothetical protein
LSSTRVESCKKEVEKKSKYKECVIKAQAKMIKHMVVVTMKKVMILEDESCIAFFNML